MTYIHSILLFLHILLGGAALVLFWVPFYTQKGQLNHRKFGAYYKNAMYAVAASGALMSIMVLSAPLAIKGHLANADSDPEKVAHTVRLFWAFLLYLSLLSFTTTRHAIAVLRARSQLTLLKAPSYILPIVLLAVLGPALAYLGYSNNQTLHMVFGVLGFIVGVNMLKYCFKKELAQREWILEHIGAMIGSGIGAYTAFLAFGGRVLFSDLGQWQIAFWVAPGVIGSVASYVMTKKYSKVFSVTPKVASSV
ncbi:hypothetical protein EYS14_20110 [Alteromonadaceae bacterium M269]|nr:hypothetical protein EYS14_20110 [Alteromonadaceae bacterium M269]